MSAPESTNQRSIWLAAAALAGTVLFRCNSGKAWLSGGGKPQRMADGTVLLPGGRPVALGLALTNGDPVVGQSDLIGWHSIVVTPDMVGCRVAVIVGMECKRETGGRTSQDQQNFVTQITNAGGIAGIANTPAVAQALIRDWRPPKAT